MTIKQAWVWMMLNKGAYLTFKSNLNKGAYLTLTFKSIFCKASSDIQNELKECYQASHWQAS